MKRVSLIAAALSLACAATASAQTYPSKPLRVIVGFAAGGLIDTLARTLQPRLQAAFGQPILIENQGGGSGTIGEGMLAKAAPDGYTAMMTSDSVPANVHLFRNLAYDVFRDLRPVSMLTRVPLVLLVHPSVPASTPQEFVAYARSRNGKVNYASPGTGTSNHLYMEVFKGVAGFDMTHVAYKGGAPAMNDLLGGQVDAILISITLAAAHARSGKLKAAAVTSDKRNPQLPQVPTFTEAGFKDFNPHSWSGLFLPAATPQPIVQRLHADFATALRDPDVQKRFGELGAEIVMNSPDQFAAFLKNESERLGRLIRERSISAD